MTLALSATTDQLQLWTSKFGEEYTKRNDQPRPERVASWRRIMSELPVKRILEVGCNVGWNLSYLSSIDDYDTFGVEPQPYAVLEARASRPDSCIVQAHAFDLPFKSGYFDLVFTAGVLIHIHPRDLERAMDEIYRVSSRYVLYIEYDANEETEIHYRDNSEALWKRDHRALWQERYPSLSVVRSGFLGQQQGFDDCTWCLFEKAE